jgi:NAD(P)H-dependent FMN reductase
MNIAIISGSARPERQSHQVALAVQERISKLGYSNWIWDIKTSAVPLLDYTFDEHPNPGDHLKQVKANLDQTDAFIIVSPEHNGSYPGALKNAMDYFYKPYVHKVFGIVTVSNGVLGGINALKNLQHYVVKVNGILSPEFLITPEVQKLFNEGKVNDDKYGHRMDVFLDHFLKLAGALAAGK